MTTALEAQFGLHLSPRRRELEAPIVDDIRREASLVVLAQVGRVTRAAPATVRRGIADLLTIR